jgi:hypothetical protein
MRHIVAGFAARPVQDSLGFGRGIMLREFTLIVFCILAGYAASGIVACVYRMVATKPVSRTALAIHWAVMIFAGPNVLLENANRNRKTQNCSTSAFWFAAVVAGYWSLALGLVVVQVGKVLG